MFNERIRSREEVGDAAIASDVIIVGNDGELRTVSWSVLCSGDQGTGKIRCSDEKDENMLPLLSGVSWLST